MLVIVKMENGTCLNGDKKRSNGEAKDQGERG